MVEKNILQKYQYSILVGGLTFVGFILAFFLVVNPLYQKSKSITVEANTKQAALTKLRDKKAKLEALKDREDELKADAKIVEDALPTSAEAGRLFIQLDGLANASKGKVSSISIGGSSSGAQASAVSTGAGISKLTYAMPVDFTSYFDFKDFINKTENALRLVDITGLSIGSGQSGFSASINAETFTRK